ncbi:MAG: hypothetical protein ACI4RN_04840, partial [Oscillospiraceae bacterium]
ERNDIMNALIVCKQLNENLSVLGKDMPTALLDITGKPLISYILEQVCKAEIKKIYILSEEYEQQIENAVGNKYNNIPIEYMDNFSFGTFEFFDSDDLIMIRADCLFNFDFNKIIKFHQKQKYDYTSVTTENNIYTGINIISKHMLQKLDLSEMTKDEQSTQLYKEKGYFQKICNTADFLKWQNDMLNGITGIEIKAKSSHKSIYSESDNNFNGVSIIPPVYIGKNAVIKSGSVIGPNTVISENSIIDSRATIENSYIGSHSVIKSKAQIDNSIICCGAHIGNNAIINKNAVVGQKCIVGHSSNIAEGVKIYEENIIDSGDDVQKDVKHGKRLKFYIDDNGKCCFLEKDVLPDKIVKLGMAIGTSINTSRTVVIGCGFSETSKHFSDCLSAGISATGIKVYNIAQCTENQIIFSVKKISAFLGCYIDAANILRVTVKGKCGVNLPDKIIKDIESMYNSSTFRCVDYKSYGKICSMTDSKELYSDFLKGILPAKFKSINADVRCSDMNISNISDNLIRPLNNVDGEHIVFQLSSNGESCTAYTESTGYVYPERLLLLGIKICFENRIPIALPYTFPSEAETLAEKNDGIIYRYNGDISTKEGLKAYQVSHRADNMFINDGLMLVCMICDYLNEKNLTFEQAMKEIPEFSYVERYISVSNNKEHIYHKLKAAGNELRFQGVNSKAIVKPLKQNMGIMLYAESYKAEQASAICDEIEKRLKEMENGIERDNTEPNKLDKQ